MERERESERQSERERELRNFFMKKAGKQKLRPLMPDWNLLKLPFE